MTFGVGRFLVLCGCWGALWPCAFACSSSGSTSGGPGGGAAGARAGSAGASSGTAGVSNGSGGVNSGTAGASSGVAGASSGTAGTTSYPMTPDGACRASVEAQCEVKVRCGLYSDVSLCTSVEDLCPDLYFSPGSTRTVAAVFACLDELRNEPCPAHLAGFVPACLGPGTVADGAPCSYSTQCASGACSAADGASCTSCEHQPGLGDACKAFDCATGYLCDPGTKLCVASPTAAPAGEGQACNVTGSPFVACQANLGCGPTAASSTPVCHVLPGEGQSCATDSCAPPLRCQSSASSTSICVDPDSCSSPPCPSGSHCVYPDSGASTCMPYAKTGQACDTTLAVCGSGLICKNAKCIARPHVGDPCDEGDCPTLFSCVNGVCRAPAPVPCP
ncbi:MAG: hypothetical protein ABI627_03100 [Polyangiaceae bacterium]